MASFKDNAEREWTIALTIGSIRAVRDRLGVNLTDFSETGIYQRLRENRGGLVNALFVLCEPQAIERGVSDVDFGRAFVGCEHQGYGALFDELGRFSGSDKADMLRKLLEFIDGNEKEGVSCEAKS